MPRKPVWDGYLADPFVLPTADAYYAYGTGGPDAPGCFAVLRSDDLGTWQHLGYALHPEDVDQASSYWAPEVIERDGLFHMFYSRGGSEGEGHQVRVATSSHPAGPYRNESPPLLPDEPFSIDANPFVDPRTNLPHLFFAKDFFDERVGTGIAAVGLTDDLSSPIGSPTTILRASADWHIYERGRHWYGQTWDAWHTVEGPFVVYRLDRYWLFFSGGLWKGPDYGVGVAVADEILGPYLNIAPDGPTILKSGGDLIGPGHNSVVEGPNGDYLVYHAWNKDHTARQMYIEPLDWSADGPRLLHVESSVEGYR